jgi:hypothetical protein
MKNYLQFCFLLLPFLSNGQAISYLENTVLFSNPAATVKYKFFTTSSLRMAASNSQLGNFRYQLSALNYSKLADKIFNLELVLLLIYLISTEVDCSKLMPTTRSL